MKEIMKKIVALEGILSCCLVDKEGEIIEYSGENKIDESLAAAMIASISRELSTQMAIPDNFSITVLAEERTLFIITHKNFILAVFTTPDIDTGKIRFELRKSVKDISQAL